jgi:hypothetical protein
VHGIAAQSDASQPIEIVADTKQFRKVATERIQESLETGVCLSRITDAPLRLPGTLSTAGIATNRDLP